MIMHKDLKILLQTAESSAKEVGVTDKQLISIAKSAAKFGFETGYSAAAVDISEDILRTTKKIGTLVDKHGL